MPTYNILKNIKWVGPIRDGLSKTLSLTRICVLDFNSTIMDLLIHFQFYNRYLILIIYAQNVINSNRYPKKKGSDLALDEPRMPLSFDWKVHCIQGFPG